MLSYRWASNPIRDTNDEEDTKKNEQRFFVRTSLISFAHPARSKPSLHFPVSLYSIVVVVVPTISSLLISGSGTAIALYRLCWRPPPRCLKNVHAVDDFDVDADADDAENDFATRGTTTIRDDDRAPLLTTFGAFIAAHR